MLAMAAGELRGLPLAAPRGARQVGQVLIATALGLYFTPAVAHEVLAHGFLILLAALVTILVGYFSGRVLTRLTRIDTVTAFFASVPGGATEMAVLGKRFGGRVDQVALAQSLRILIVVIVVPSVLTWVGARGADAYVPGPTVVHAGGLGLLLGLAVLGGWLFSRLKVPNAWMLGPLTVSIALTASGTRLSGMPVFLTNAGQVLVGCALGARFERRFLVQAPRFMAGAITSTLFAIILSGLVAAGLAWMSSIGVPTLVLATAPGGIAEMCITAQVLQLGVPLVTAFHVARVIVLTTGSAPLFRLAQRVKAQR